MTLDIYKSPRAHEVHVPRTGDIAEVLRSHCEGNKEAGLLVEVMGRPHMMYANCAKCGTAYTEYMVEIWSSYEPWQRVPGPWFMPIGWLKRLDPRDPVQFERIRNYQPMRPTAEQIRLANLR